MSERVPDDTPKTPDAPTPRGVGRPGDYYYDDATGYEVYDPDADEEEDDGDSEGEPTTSPPSPPT